MNHLQDINVDILNQRLKLYTKYLLPEYSTLQIPPGKDQAHIRRKVGGNYVQTMSSAETEKNISN